MTMMKMTMTMIITIIIKIFSIFTLINITTPKINVGGMGRREIGNFKTLEFNRRYPGFK
jgi:hypothetical protein